MLASSGILLLGARSHADARRRSGRAAAPGRQQGGVPEAACRSTRLSSLDTRQPVGHEEAEEAEKATGEVCAVLAKAHAGVPSVMWQEWVDARCQRRRGRLLECRAREQHEREARHAGK